MERIRKGDDVIVTAGRDKGKRGSVLRIRDVEGAEGGANDAPAE